MIKPTPSPRELEILKILWGQGSCSVREVHRLMCPDDELAFNTVQTLLRIMDDKGLVSHKKRGRTFVYSAQYSRERETSRFLDKVFDGAMDQFVVSMLESKNPSLEELQQIETLISEARNRKQKSNQGGE